MEKAKTMLVKALENQYDNYDSKSDVSMDIFHSCIQAEKFRNVFFIKLKHDSNAAKYCPLIRNNLHKGIPKRSYCVNINSGKIIVTCFSSKCRLRNGGRITIVEADNNNADTSSEDEDVL